MRSARHAGALAARRRARAVSALRAAEVDLAARTSGDEAAQRGGVEAHALARADAARCRRPPRRRDLGGDLVAQDELVAAWSARSSTVDVGAPRGSSCSSARIGAVPTPAPISSSRSLRRGVGGEGAVGPSIATRVPGRSRARPPLWSPRSLTVMRSWSPAGAADSEYGCACHHSPRRRKRHWKNWPPATGSRSSRRPAQHDRDDARALGRDGDDPHAVAQRAPERQADPRGDDDAERRRATAPSTTRARRDARRTRRPCRSGARRTGTARGRCRGARDHQVS